MNFEEYKSISESQMNEKYEIFRQIFLLHGGMKNEKLINDIIQEIMFVFYKSGLHIDEIIDLLSFMAHSYKTKLQRK